MTPPRRGPILVLGDINTDLLMPVAHYPRPGQEAMSRALRVTTGGSAANTAVMLAHLGLPVSLIARLGADPWGDRARRALDEQGVDTRAVQCDAEHPTGMTFIPALPGGEHSMFCYRGANDYTDPDALPEELFRAVSLLHVSGYALAHEPQRRAAARAVELAARNGVPLSLDTALEPALQWADEMRWLLPQLALCVLGLEEAHALTGRRSAEQAAQSLLESGVGLVGLKLGAEGCLLARHGESVRLPAFQMATVDSTGAGDAFSAGLIFAWRQRLGLPACALLAAALGGLATTVWGGGEALPSRAELLEWLQAQSPDLDQSASLEEAVSALLI